MAATLPYEDIARSLAARHIVTPLDDIVGCSLDESPATFAEELGSNAFDWGAVFEHGTIVGRVSQRRLHEGRGSISDSMEPLAPDYLVSADSPIGDVMRWLGDDPWLLAVEANTIAGLVTPADLNRQAARVYFYLLVTDLEIQLSDAIRERFPTPADALAVLPGKDRKGVSGRYDNMRAADMDVDLIEAMDLRHLIRIAGDVPALVDRFSPASADWDEFGQEVGDLRNQTMHATRALLADNYSLDRLLSIESMLREVLGTE